jgi:hypothetical protein
MMGLLKAPAPGRTAACEAGTSNAIDPEPSELVQLVDQHLGRVAVARAVLSEPGVKSLCLYPPTDSTLRPMPPRMPSAFRSLKAWRDVVATYHPTHFDPLNPRSPLLSLGRLVSEGVVDVILTTNWDAYIEVGCLLVGVRVGDCDEATTRKEGWLSALPAWLWVYETPSEAAFFTRPQAAVALFKLHGGVRTILGILTRLLHGEIGRKDAEVQLRRTFLVSSEDLVHWREINRWVAEATGDTVRSHRVLMVGLSGADPVIYRAMRERAREWEDSAQDPANQNVAGQLPVWAADLRPTLRLRNMLSVRARSGANESVAQAGAGSTLRGAYAWWLLSHLTRALSCEDLAEARTKALLRSALAAELASSSAGDPTPLLDLLDLSIGPGSRWAAIAERRGPFQLQAISSPLFPFRRWWYAPWGLERGGAGGGPQRAALRETAGFAAVLACCAHGRPRPVVQVEPWTGVVRLPSDHPLAARHPCLHGTANLLPLPWPWASVKGATSPSLGQELREGFGWGPGRSLDHLAAAPLFLVPLPWPDPQTIGELQVGGVPSRLLPPPGHVRSTGRGPGKERDPSWLETAKEWLA